MKFVKIISCCLISLVFANKAFAATCAAVFPDVVSSYSSAGNIVFKPRTTLYDTDGIIDIAIGTDDSITSCDSSKCVSSGNTSASLIIPTFNYTNSSQDAFGKRGLSYFIHQGSYDDITMSENTSLTFRSDDAVTRIDNFNIGKNSTLVFAEGEYWIDHLTIDENTIIEVKSGERAILYVNKFSLEDDLLFNISGDEDQLTIVAMDDIDVKKRTQMRGFLYVKEDLKWEDDGLFYGAINAKNIEIKEDSVFYTRLAGLDTAMFNGACEQNQSLPEPKIYYSMDMCSAPSGSNAINDEIGALDADANGSIDVNYTGKHCQAANFSGIQSYIDIPDPATVGLLSGSISLYFNTSDLTYSNSASKGAMTLFSRDASGTETGGHISAWVTDSGGISVRQQSASNDYSVVTNSGIIQESQWHHLVYTWGANGMNIYIDSVLRGQYSSYTGGFSANGVDMAVGANAWQYNPSSSSTRTDQMRDFFKGSIDEFKVFDEQLSLSQITNLAALASQDCDDCTVDPVLVAYWGIDACSINQNQIVESVAGLHATAQNGVELNVASRFCQGLSFSGNQSYATVPHDNRLLIENGAISLWFNIPDLSHSNNPDIGGNGLIAKDKQNYSNGGHLELSVDSLGKISVRHQTTSQTNSFSTAALVQEGQWHHLVYSFGANGVHVYLDNVLEYSDINYTNSIVTNDEVLVFGATARYANRHETSANNFRDFFKGEMDEIKFFENQPNAADVNEWYTETPNLCTTCNSLFAFYDFDQTNVATASIEDSSGNNNTGTLGASLSMELVEDNVSCRAISTLQNAATDPQFYFDTGVDVNNVGNQGSVSFWYKSNSAWNDGTARQLFDATDAVSDIYFFLAKQSDGSLRFAFEDTQDRDLVITTGVQSFAANTWVNISVQWNMESSEYSIYINGQVQALTITNGLISSSTLGSLTSLVFGDNKSSYNVNGASTNPSHGYFDEIRIYTQAISSTQITLDMQAVAACSQVDHYLIEHPATALTCDSPEVIVKACADVNCTTLSAFPSSITITPDIFTTSNAVTFTGQVSLTVDNQTPGIITLGSNTPDPIGNVQCSNNCEIDFESVGVQFFNKTTGLLDFSNSHFIAQDDLDEVGIRIVGANSNGVCDGLVQGNKDISLTYECVNTVADNYTPTSCNVPFANIPLSQNSSHTGTVNLSFDGNGESHFGDFNFADSGILKLTASANINNVTVEAASIELNIIPANILMTASNSLVNTAGSPLPLSLTALGSLGAVLPGYQSNDLQFSAQRLIPNNVNGHDSQFYLNTNTNVTTSLNVQFEEVAMTFANGIASSTTAYMEEVGTYTIDVQDNDYLGAVIDASSITLGRFIPAYFDVQQSYQPTLQNSCDASFTYVGDSFSYTAGLEPSVIVSAYNAIGQITRNYTDILWTLNPAALALANQYQLTDKSVYTGTLSQATDVSSITVSGTDLYDGMATFVANGISHSYTKIAAPTGTDASPFDGQLDYSLNQVWFTDADNVCYQSSYPNGCEDYTFNDVDGINMRYGRVNVKNAFGPENEPLSVPLHTEYLDAGLWRVNNQDNCTDFSLTQAASEIVATHDQQSSVDLASTITGMSIATVVIDGVAPLEALELGPYLNGSEPQSGSFYIELAPSGVSGHWSNHLNFDWNNDGVINNDDKPAANINFGIYNSNERTLHWREVLN